MVTAGEHFARALAAKDSAALCTLLADPVNFQALTPGRLWQATTGRQVADEIIFEHWFGAGAHILELCSVSTGRVSQREHVAYRMRVRRSGADHLVEQQAYYSTDGGRIGWMRVLCSGYQPVQPERLAAADRSAGRAVPSPSPAVDGALLAACPVRPADLYQTGRRRSSCPRIPDP